MRTHFAAIIGALALTGCAGFAVVGNHTSNAAVNGVAEIGDLACDVTQDYVGVGGFRVWRHEQGSTRVYGTAGIKKSKQCFTADPDYTDISPGANLLVIREFNRRRQ